MYTLVFLWPFLQDVLVIPIRVVKRYSDLSSLEVADIFRTVQRVQGVMEKVHDTTSSTVVIQDGPDAGQTIWVNFMQDKFHVVKLIALFLYLLYFIICSIFTFIFYQENPMIFQIMMMCIGYCRNIKNKPIGVKKKTWLRKQNTWKPFLFNWSIKKWIHSIWQHLWA